MQQRLRPYIYLQSSKRQRNLDIIDKTSVDFASYVNGFVNFIYYTKSVNNSYNIGYIYLLNFNRTSNDCGTDNCDDDISCNKPPQYIVHHRGNYGNDHRFIDQVFEKYYINDSGLYNCRRIYSGDNGFSYNKPTKYGVVHRRNYGHDHRKIDQFSGKYYVDSSGANNDRSIYTGYNNFSYDKPAKYGRVRRRNYGDDHWKIDRVSGEYYIDDGRDSHNHRRSYRYDHRNIDHISGKYYIDDCRAYNCRQVYPADNNIPHNPRRNNGPYHFIWQHITNENNFVYILSLLSGVYNARDTKHLPSNYRPENCTANNISNSAGYNGANFVKYFLHHCKTIDDTYNIAQHNFVNIYCIIDDCRSHNSRRIYAESNPRDSNPTKYSNVNRSKENNCRPIYSGDNNFDHNKATNYSDDHRSNDGDVYRNTDYISRKYYIDDHRNRAYYSYNQKEHHG
ncbi:Hypp7046 [Branchiostoma lanceolatum]|uniref:Hypp7046 protein n=1 Tax=Branchiostoma lanceolatum TaxID=7740 RepID=A0A8J9YWS9_BRALA|nr:Hypp7046 [Branchiostoma lanceolatum]